jgi:hypothetical protein
MTTKEAAIQQPLTSNSFANKNVCMATTGNSNGGMAFSVHLIAYVTTVNTTNNNGMSSIKTTGVGIYLTYLI